MPGSKLLPNKRACFIIPGRKERKIYEFDVDKPDNFRDPNDFTTPHGKLIKA